MEITRIQKDHETTFEVKKPGEQQWASYWTVTIRKANEQDELDLVDQSDVSASLDGGKHIYRRIRYDRERKAAFLTITAANMPYDGWDRDDIRMIKLFDKNNLKSVPDEHSSPSEFPKELSFAQSWYELPKEIRSMIIEFVYEINPQWRRPVQEEEDSLEDWDRELEQENLKRALQRERVEIERRLALLSYRRKSRESPSIGGKSNRDLPPSDVLKSGFLPGDYDDLS